MLTNSLSFTMELMLLVGKTLFPMAGLKKPYRNLLQHNMARSFWNRKLFLICTPGGWYYQCPLTFCNHEKMRLYDVRGWWAQDPFFMYDVMTKLRLRAYNSLKTVKVGHLSQPLDAGGVLSGEYSTEPYARVIPGSRQHWKSFCLDLTAFTEQRGILDFFLTLSAYDGWPQVQATLSKGWGGHASANECRHGCRYSE